MKEGDTVAKDAVLLRFGDREQYDAALTAAQLERQSAQKALKDLNDQAGVASGQAQVALSDAQQALVDARQQLADVDTDQHQTDVDNAEKNVADAKSDLSDAQDDFDKYKNLDIDNNDRKRTEDALTNAQRKYDEMVRKRDTLVNELHQAQAAIKAAQARVDDAQREVDARQNGPDPDELALAQARLTHAEAQVKSAQNALDNLEVRAPFAGTIVDLNLAVGETLLSNQSILQMADFGANQDDWYVETNDLTEMEVVRINQGQPATITPDALPDLHLPATVESIKQVSGSKGGDVTYLARLKLDQTDPRLRWGMTVEVRFEQ